MYCENCGGFECVCEMNEEDFALGCPICGLDAGTCDCICPVCGSETECDCYCEICDSHDCTCELCEICGKKEVECICDIDNPNFTLMTPSFTKKGDDNMLKNDLKEVCKICQETWETPSNCPCPLGGCILNNCEDCAYSSDYNYADGECVRRNEINAI